MNSYQLQRANQSDLPRFNSFLGKDIFLHKHLDWRAPADWLGRQPFWFLTRNEEILGTLACPSEPEGMHWVRIFGTVYPPIAPAEGWEWLMEKTILDLEGQGKCVLAALCLHTWFEDILVSNGFDHRQDIVVLDWKSDLPPALRMPADLIMRRMRESDLDEVAVLDQLSFDPLWQNPAASLKFAFDQACYATVVERDLRIIGYQISTPTAYGIHLARLAVHPDARRANIGYNMVRDLQQYARLNRIRLVSVNTQSDNQNSLALYRKMGFERTGELLPVYTLQV